MDTPRQDRDIAPLVSVVTPFFNTARWLAECIESVLAQSLGHFEYILLDNCSSDGSADIAQEYARHDRRIRYFRNQQFLRQHQNYNAALGLISPASGYTKIVSSDDVIYQTCLADMVRVAQQHCLVGVVGGIALRGRTVSEGSKAVADWPFATEAICGRTAAAYQLMHSVRFVTSTTTVLYRSDVVRQKKPFFHETCLHADMRTFFEILRDWDFGFVSEPLTFVRSRDEGVSAGILTIDPLCHLLDEFMQTTKFGREFLTADEFDRCWLSVRKDYFEHLARNALSNRREEFWEHHKNGWDSIGYSMTQRTLLVHAILLCLRIFFDPVRLSRFLRNRIEHLAKQK